MRIPVAFTCALPDQVLQAIEDRVVRETARQDLLSLEQRGLLRKHRIGKGFVWTPAADLPRRLREPDRAASG